MGGLTKNKTDDGQMSLVSRTQEEPHQLASDELPQRLWKTCLPLYLASRRWGMETYGILEHMRK